MEEKYVAFLGRDALNGKNDYAFTDYNAAEAYVKSKGIGKPMIVQFGRIIPLEHPVSAEQGISLGYALITELEGKEEVFTVKNNFWEIKSAKAKLNGRKSEIRKIILMEEKVVIDDLLFPIDA